MYDVIELSQYIINESNDKEYEITNLRLQKLLYFIQVLSLKLKKEPLFEEDIEAWDYGPVVPKSYHEFKSFGSLPLPKKQIDIEISNIDKIIVDKILVTMSSIKTYDLVNISHSQKPWKEAYKREDNKIYNEEIRDYFMGAK